MIVSISAGAVYIKWGSRNIYPKRHENVNAQRSRNGNLYQSKAAPISDSSLRLMETKRFRTIEELAVRLKMDVCYVRRIRKFVNLAPDILQTILDGNEYGNLTRNTLRKGISLL